ncbi:hypothetical protein FVE85_5786 [Porphyridium purpureum]|uniref:Protein NUCLEAR FUSION DEFECTIVE 4 n=1 Tax=Porphyridium purpureum TaxID=35688 RepID=A0A5J4Z2V6_PORPP|nr:hypothetical protein FVE85_5786 [Porphyridium purpureum]|eukprot:POR4405..scf295_1
MKRPILTVVGCCVLCGFGAGGFLGLTVLTKAIADNEELADFSNALAVGLGTQYFISALGMILAANLVLSQLRLRRVLIWNALCMLVLQLCLPAALTVGSKAAFVLLMAVQGMTIGVAYIYAVETAVAAAESPGLALGLVTAAVPGGQVLCTLALSVLLNMFSIPRTLAISAFLFVVPVLLVAPLFPDTSLGECQIESHEYDSTRVSYDIDFDTESVSASESATPALTSAARAARAVAIPLDAVDGDANSKLLSDAQAEARLLLERRKVDAKAKAEMDIGVPMRWWELMCEQNFLMLALIVMAGAGPSYGILFVFGRAAEALTGASDALIASLISVLSVYQGIIRFAAGAGSDKFKAVRVRFLAWSGAKNLMIVFMGGQALACFVLIKCSTDHEHPVMSHVTFLLCMFGVFGACGACGVLSAVLAHEVFSAENGAMVISILNGVFDGFTTLVFTLLVVHLAPPEKHVSHRSMASSRIGYSKFFVYCLVLSVAGLLGAAMVGRSRRAWRGVVISPI